MSQESPYRPSLMNCCSKRAVLLLYLVLVAFRPDGHAQEPADSVLILFHVEDLYYQSPFEYQVFDEIEDGDRNYLALLTCNEPGITGKEVAAFHRWIEDIAASIRQERFDRLNEEKKINVIGEHLIGTLLKTYNQSATFTDLYKSGHFNYLTEACLYALVMDELNIPYIIKESSSHLYLLAFPKTEKIIIETAIPEFRYKMFNLDMRTRFVSYLRENNLIDEITYRSETTRDVFEKYFFSQKDFTLKELAGLQYMHKALIDIESADSKSACLNLQKAYYLFPSCRMQFLLLLEYYTFIENADLTITENLAYFRSSPKLIPVGFDPDFFLDQFRKLTETYLSERKDVAEYGLVYRYLVDQDYDRNLSNGLSFIYYYEIGKYYYNSGKYELALDNLEKAYDINHQDKNLQILFVGAVAGYASTTGSSDLIPRLEFYEEEYSIGEGHDIFLMVLMHAFLQYAGESFQVEDVTTGEEYLAKFDTLHRDNPDIGIDQYLIGRSYSSAAIYYFRKGNVARSRQLVLKGLELAPGNIELQLKLDSFKD